MTEAREREHALSVLVSRTLAAGMGLSLVTMAGGLLFALAGGKPIGSSATPFSEIAPAALAGDPTACLSLGLAVLLATPAVRVLVLLVSYARRRDWLFAGIALAVLSILAASVALGVRH